MSEAGGAAVDHRAHPGYGVRLEEREIHLGRVINLIDCLHLCRDSGVLTAWNAELLRQIKMVPAPLSSLTAPRARAGLPFT